MTSPEGEGVSLILEAVRHGESGAEERLFRLVYRELHRLAHRQMAREAPGRTLQTTALIHEAYLRMFGGRTVKWENRRHFFGAAARAMRQILVEKARERAAAKRDWGGKRVTLADDVAGTESPQELLALDEALSRFAEDHPRQAEVVKLRYFLGLSVAETAELLGIAPRTVDYDWQLAKAWLLRAMDRG